MGDFKPGGRRPRRDSEERSRRGYSRDRPRRDSRDRPRRRDSEEVTMHKAVCDECGKTCEVPFKPTPGKPVYCDDCFKKKDKSGKSNFSEEFEKINEKLDKILEAIEDNS